MHFDVAVRLDLDTWMHDDDDGFAARSSKYGL